MKQSAQKVDDTLAWKEEVNRRVAEHKERKTAATNEPQAHAEVQPAASSRAAQAAARVAARYAKAPSYSDMLADEARAAVRAAEAASRAALEAQAAAESVLAGLEARSSAEQAHEPEFFTAVVPEPVRPLVAEPVRGAAAQPSSKTSPNRPTTSKSSSGNASPRPSFEIRWDADLPVREASPAAARASHRTTIYETPEVDGLEMVEAAQPIHANLIEFPRELIATRKVRPRRAEGVHAATADEPGQLSIFEVDPFSICTEPSAASTMAEANAAIWAGPQWSGIELDEEPLEEIAAPAAPAVEREALAAAVMAFPLAPMNQRIMAVVVDFSLITGAFLAAALVAAANVKVLPTLKQMELGSAVALALIGALYLAFFFILARATPGMKYARLEICTFAGKKPTLVERCGRMVALLVSLAPLGLGAAMALFDEQHLCWHDRLSGTYLRRG
ncbi:MAG TPA: RDD family protein [Terracidiphilus sp.]